MRFFMAAVLSLAVIISPMAHAESGIVFGSATCREPVPCPGSFLTRPSPALLAQKANDCIANNFGVSRPSGYFEEKLGLDGSNCLTLKPDVPTKGTPPQCCVIAMPDKTCTFQCKLITKE